MSLHDDVVDGEGAISATKFIGPIFFADHKFTPVLHCAATLNDEVVTGEPVPFFSKPVQQLTEFFNVFIIYHMLYC
jgi:hypothetical protein